MTKKKIPQTIEGCNAELERTQTKTARLNELNALLNVDKRENEIVGGEPDEGEETPEKKPRDLER